MRGSTYSLIGRRLLVVYTLILQLFLCPDKVDELNNLDLLSLLVLIKNDYLSDRILKMFGWIHFLCYLRKAKFPYCVVTLRYFVVNQEVGCLLNCI